jgi:Major Facilitator Superfamily.
VTTASTSVTALSISGFLEWLGATAVLPLLPLFLKEHGCSDGTIGAIIGVFFFSGVVLAYPLGKVSKVSNKKVLLIASLLSYGLSNFVFIAASRSYRLSSG